MKEMSLPGKAVSAELARPEAGALAPRTMLETVMHAVADPSIDPARLREFLDIGRQLEADEARRQWTEAFFAAKNDLSGMRIKKRGAIVYEQKAGKRGGVIKFARYQDIADAIKPILAQHGLASSFSYDFTPNPPKVICVMKLAHRRGHAEEFRSVPLPMIDQSGGKTDLQGAGSVGSYGRRYVVCPAFDIVAEDEDDDGSGKGVPEQVTEQQALRIEDIVLECDNREPGFKARFLKWLKQEFEVESPAALYQGMQLKAVEDKLAEKRQALGVK